MITIEPILLEEVETLRELAIKTFRETFGHDNTEEQLQAFFNSDLSIAVLSKELTDPESQNYFLKIDGSIVGFLKLNQGSAQTEQKLDNAIEIQRVYILKAFQGQGLGKKLLEFALEKAYASGCDWVWLGVWEYNFKAQALYKKYGFERFSQHRFMVGDKADTDWLLKKSLKQA
ncbi:GNAT family N-acetyltransferase [Streptococcus orisasini]|uniref:GNAT family N-acetyltransferase n=1 Tax=Streptococcus orisasini TaxID=1080071 RepID=UPI0007092EE7|nr:GNAT family N-acetyltransferase [Streptococcus orisasini]